MNRTLLVVFTLMLLCGCVAQHEAGLDIFTNGTEGGKIWASANQSFYLDAQGNLWSWGDGANGLLGDGTTDDRYEPKVILTDVVDMGDRTALKNDGSLWTWGYGRNTPYQVDEGVLRICRGGLPFMKEDNSLWDLTWAADGGFEPYLICEDVVDARKITTSRYEYVVLKPDESMWGYGLKEYDESGLGFTVDEDPELPVFLSAEVSKLCAESHGLFYIDKGNRLMVSGSVRDYFGNPLPLSSPTLVMDNTKDIMMGLILDLEGNLYTLTFATEDNKTPIITPKLIFTAVKEITGPDTFLTTEAKLHEVINKNDWKNSIEIRLIAEDVVQHGKGQCHDLVLKKDGSIWGRSWGIRHGQTGYNNFPRSNDPLTRYPYLP